MPKPLRSPIETGVSRKGRKGRRSKEKDDVDILIDSLPKMENADENQYWAVRVDTYHYTKDDRGIGNFRGLLARRWGGAAQIIKQGFKLAIHKSNTKGYVIVGKIRMNKKRLRRLIEGKSDGQVKLILRGSWPEDLERTV